MADRYVVAAGGNWNSTATWSTSDGGAGGASVPTASDNVYLTASSGNLNVNATATCLDFDCAGYTGTLSGSSAQTVSGTKFRLSAGMTCTRTGGLTFNSTTGTCAITSAGQTLTTSGVTINGAGGAFVLQDALALGGTLYANDNRFLGGTVIGGATGTVTSSGGVGTIWAYYTLSQIEREKKAALKRAKKRVVEIIEADPPQLGELLQIVRQEVRHEAVEFPSTVVNDIISRLHMQMRAALIRRIEEDEDEADAEFLLLVA